jgi:hypothetical protein
MQKACQSVKKWGASSQRAPLKPKNHYEMLFFLIPETLDIFSLEMLPAGLYGRLLKLLAGTQLLYEFRVVDLALELLQCLINLISVV